MAANTSLNHEKSGQSSASPAIDTIQPPIAGMCFAYRRRGLSLKREHVDTPFKKLSIQDKLLTPFILLAMILGVIIGEFSPNVRNALDTAKFQSVSLRTYIVQIPLEFGTLNLEHNSNRDWANCHDVACPHQSSI
jgi:ACR3 family arsenite transporter